MLWPLTWGGDGIIEARCQLESGLAVSNNNDLSFARDRLIRSKVLRVTSFLVVCWFKNKYITRQKGQFPVQLVAAAERFTGKPNITINHHRLSAEIMK